MPGSGWVTQREAAELLGVHPSAVPKMIARGLLTARRRRPSIARDQVVELARARAAAAEERAHAVPAAPRSPRPPDDGHDWLAMDAAAAVLGCTRIALQGRCARGQVPYVVHDGRRWFRLDLLELLLRAQHARRTMEA